MEEWKDIKGFNGFFQVSNLNERLIKMAMESNQR